MPAAAAVRAPAPAAAAPPAPPAAPAPQPAPATVAPAQAAAPSPPPAAAAPAQAAQWSVDAPGATQYLRDLMATLERPQDAQRAQELLRKMDVKGNLLAPGLRLGREYPRLKVTLLTLSESPRPSVTGAARNRTGHRQQPANRCHHHRALPACGPFCGHARRHGDVAAGTGGDRMTAGKGMPAGKGLARAAWIGLWLVLLAVGLGLGPTDRARLLAGRMAV
ncbi:MAG: hypothetical protein IPJ36_19445 [Simplicispira sp.]|nr:hypothetical protein [Simplicispira sp.]